MQRRNAESNTRNDHKTKHQEINKVGPDIGRQVAIFIDTTQHCNWQLGVMSKKNLFWENQHREKHHISNHVQWC